jgi:hypothetical protein
VQREVSAATGLAPNPGADDWQSLSLVADHEVEERMFSDRIGQQITHECEWELREIAAYMGAVLNLGRPARSATRCAPTCSAMAVFRAIEAVTSDADSRKMLAREFGQAMGLAMPECYRTIVGEFQRRNVRPVGLALKTVHGPGQTANTGYTSMRDGLSSTRTMSGDFHCPRRAGLRSAWRRPEPPCARAAGWQRHAWARRRRRDAARPRALPGRERRLLRGGTPVDASGRAGRAARRRRDRVARRGRATDGAAARASPIRQPSGRPRRSLPPAAAFAPAVPGVACPGGIGARRQGAGRRPRLSAERLTGLMAVNLIRAHREELVAGSTGKARSHGDRRRSAACSDQILLRLQGAAADGAPDRAAAAAGAARRAGRLDLLLVAAPSGAPLRQPHRVARLRVRRFDDGPASNSSTACRSWCRRSSKATSTRSTCTRQADRARELHRRADRAERQDSGAATVLETKESELRIQQRYMLQLQRRSARSRCRLPARLRSPGLEPGAGARGAARRRSDLAKRFRGVGRDLVMSVQPKARPSCASAS